MEDETTKKPTVAAAVTSAPVVADVVENVVEPVKEEVAVLAEETPITDNVVVNEDEVLEVITEAGTAVKGESDSVNEVVPTENDTPVEPLTGEKVEEASAVETSASASADPVKATSDEEEGLIEGIVDTLILDDTEDGKLFKFFR